MPKPNSDDDESIRIDSDDSDSGSFQEPKRNLNRRFRNQKRRAARKEKLRKLAEYEKRMKLVRSPEFEMIKNFLNFQLSLILLEYEQNQNRWKREEDMNTGLMKITKVTSGFFGRSVLILEPVYRQEHNPIKFFDFVDLCQVPIGESQFLGNLEDGNENSLAIGIVSEVKGGMITIAINQVLEYVPQAYGTYAHSTAMINAHQITGNDFYYLVRKPDDVSFARISDAAMCLREGGNEFFPQIYFMERFYDITISQSAITSFDFIIPHLDISQKESIIFALDNKNKLAIIHGPPGTGKTTTMVEIILQTAIKTGKRVLAVAPSNNAVDNLLEKLDDIINQSKKSSNLRKLNIVRLGNPVKCQNEELHKYSLDKLISDCDIMANVSKVGAYRESFEFQELLDKATRKVLKESNIVLSTIVSASPDGALKYLQPRNPISDNNLDNNLDTYFGLLIIDECSQAIESSCWIPLPLVSGKLVLAGDHMQLPPTILSQSAAKQGLDVSMMERLVLQSRSDKNLVRKLKTQYRMNDDIMTWSNDKFYDNELVSHDSNKNRTLSSVLKKEVLEHFMYEELSPLTIIDTRGKDNEHIDDHLGSIKNSKEVKIIAAYVKMLLERYKLSPEIIGIISFYKSQVNEIKKRLFRNKVSRKIEVSTADGFQGREKEVILISFVRSNDKGKVGFLSEPRRMNVAVTRAKTHLVIICDIDTVTDNETINSLIQCFLARGDVKDQDFINLILNMKTWSNGYC